MPFTKQRLAIASSACVLAVAAGALYASASDPEASPATATQAASTPGSPSSGLSLVEKYSAYGASEQRASESVTKMIDVLNRTNDFTINPHDARGTTTAEDDPAWIIPGKNGLCFGATDDTGVGYTCGSVEALTENPVMMSAADTNGSVRAVYLVPDQTIALEAQGKRFAATNNTVTAYFKRGAKVIRVDRDGSRVETKS